MKKAMLILFAILLACSSQLFAQEEDTAAAVPDTISWFTDYNGALSAATAEDRYILFEFYTDW